MQIFSIIELLFILFYIAYLVYEYSMRSVPLYVKILVYVSWLLSFGFVFLVPLDIYYVIFFLKQWRIILFFYTPVYSTVIHEKQITINAKTDTAARAQLRIWYKRSSYCLLEGCMVDEFYYDVVIFVFKMEKNFLQTKLLFLTCLF